MRVLCTALFFCTFFAAPARAQSPGSAWEVGFGPHVIYREASSTIHFGGGFTVARTYERIAVVLEGSGTRRQGHNDWRVIGGPRAIFGRDARSSYFAQALGGTLIRQNRAGWAVLPGLGFDVRSAAGRAVRVLVDVPIEHTQAHTTASVRASIWFVF